MNSPPIRNFLTWLPLIAAIVGGAIAWGSTNERVNQLEVKATTAVQDHDRIIRIETQITQITRGQGELKEDVKELERAINAGFADLLKEINKERDG